MLFLQQARAARLQRTLHVDVSASNVASPFEDFRVHAVAVEKSLVQAELLEALDGLRELVIGPFGVALLVRDATQPDMCLGDVRPFMQPFREGQRLLGKLTRLLDVVLLETKLAQAQQHVAAAHFEVSLLA